MKELENINLNERDLRVQEELKKCGVDETSGYYDFIKTKIIAKVNKEMREESKARTKARNDKKEMILSSVKTTKDAILGVLENTELDETCVEIVKEFLDEKFERYVFQKKKD